MGQHRRCLDVGSDGSSICRVSPRPQAKATKSKREEPESAGAFREFIEGAGPTDKAEQGGIVIRSTFDLMHFSIIYLFFAQRPNNILTKTPLSRSG